MSQTPDQDNTDRTTTAILLGLAAIYFLIEFIPGVLGSYGYFIDEFYYLACADHLAAGYVDHPPLSILLLWAVRAVAGDSLAAVRVVPALAGAMTIVIIGLMARRLGANRLGQVLAAVAAMTSSVYHVFFSYYSMNALALLMWSAGFWLLIEIERRNSQRLWLAFGGLTGVGLLNKHTFVMLPLCLAVAMVFTSARRHLARRWFWLGCAVAVGLVLPNLVWQHYNGWPSIEFYRNADLFKNLATPPVQVVLQQILMMNPGAMVVWVAGLVFFLATRRGRPLRHLGLVYLWLLIFMLVGQKSRPDRIAGAYPVLLAGGGTLLGDLAQRQGLGWLRRALPAVLVLAGMGLAPLGLPLLPPAMLARYAVTLGVVPRIEQGEGKMTQLPQWTAYRLGWESYVDDVAAVVREIPPEERQRAIILVPTYGQAGALEILGRGRDLPSVYATQNSYYHWGPPPDSVDVTIVTGPFSESTVRSFYDSVQLARVRDCDWCMPWLGKAPIWIARDQRAPLGEVWPMLKHYE
ncbi:ArnT family glycosyltransferase [Candidatus Eisenbacteria bacterium]|uniref:ArnT family glycosyltransferase n=1 Tax=Eiseniibacteriota bacterium TaxID=2212470 RepID=A0ABV6YMN0_UNCEI